MILLIAVSKADGIYRCEPLYSAVNFFYLFIYLFIYYFLTTSDAEILKYMFSFMYRMPLSLF
jgi:hypothetical protein